ncbi:MAG: flagellar biosynthetic protein FliR, partial [Clostridiales bacterium]|nr:flagellar biosynthetic protein FliR [Clostridiales bacterium]
FQFLFLALQLAGQILSFNMGMSMAVMNDPSSGASTTVLAELINVYAILLFFAMDGHLLLVSVLYKGFTYWPIGNALHPQTLRTIALAFSWVLASASLLALPTTFIMLIVQGCFGLLNRIAPPLNLFSLGFPVNPYNPPCLFQPLPRLFDIHFPAPLYTFPHTNTRPPHNCYVLPLSLQSDSPDTLFQKMPLLHLHNSPILPPCVCSLCCQLLSAPGISNSGYAPSASSCFCLLRYTSPHLSALACPAAKCASASGLHPSTFFQALFDPLLPIR